MPRYQASGSRLEKGGLRMKKFLALFDLHVGKEYIDTKGKLVLQDTHNERAIKAVLEFSKDFKPDVLILGGDQINAGPCSHWNHGKPRLVEGFRIKDEMDRLDELVLTPFEKTLAKKNRKIFLIGNHEVWIRDFVNENPGVEGLVEPENYLSLTKRKYEIYSQGEIATVGKLNFVHGDVVLGRGGANPATKLVMAYQRNIRAGHLHTYSAAVLESPVDRQDYHTGVVVPSLSTRCPAFIKYNPNKFINGFLYGYFWSDGFSDEVVIVNKNEFVVGGKKYKG